MYASSTLKCKPKSKRLKIAKRDVKIAFFNKEKQKCYTITSRKKNVEQTKIPTASLRQYFPKKIKQKYSVAYLADCLQKLNMRPRKCLKFASPASRFFFEFSRLHFKVESAVSEFPLKLA